MKEAEYATDRYLVLNIVLLVLVIGLVVAYEVSREDFRIWRSFRGLIVPAICILIPEILEGLSGNSLSAKFIRLAGWGLLFFVLLYPLCLRALFY